jgi:hypothetical protein
MSQPPGPGAWPPPAPWSPSPAPGSPAGGDPRADPGGGRPGDGTPPQPASAPPAHLPVPGSPAPQPHPGWVPAPQGSPDGAGAAGVPPVPPPPPGPGVRAPFATPPTERDRKRLWIGIAVGAVLVVLCCGGGIFGFGALIYSQSRALPAEATKVVSNYLDGLRDGDYRKAYDQLCGDLHDRQSLEQFTNTQRRRPPVTEYTLQVPQFSGSQVIVDAEVTTATTNPQVVRFFLIQDQQAGGLRICGTG